MPSDVFSTTALEQMKTYATAVTKQLGGLQHTNSVEVPAVQRRQSYLTEKVKAAIDRTMRSGSAERKAFARIKLLDVVFDRYLQLPGDGCELCAQPMTFVGFSQADSELAAGQRR